MQHFPFLHTADWHVGRPFHAFDPSVRSALQLARTTIVNRIAGAARAANVCDVLVAGDVFDSQTVADGDVRALMSGLSQASDLTWHIIPGNHDFVRQHGIWMEWARTFPQNVRIYTTPGVHKIRDHVALLVCPCDQSSTSTDPTAWMESCETPDSTFRIGLAHGGLSRVGDGVIPAQAADRARLDFLALGDWHSTLEVSDRCWYAGTPEPTKFNERDAGWALHVTVHDREPPTVSRIATARHQWLTADLSFDPVGTLTKVRSDLAAMPSMGGDPLVKVIRSGEQPVGVQEAVDRLVSEIEPLCLRLPQHGAFETSADVSDAALDGLDPLFQPIVERLRGPASDELGTDAVRKAALRALMREVSDVRRDGREV
ncbi:MAG: metallophosphoesterase [Pseudomonadota bacterium]